MTGSIDEVRLSWIATRAEPARFVGKLGVPAISFLGDDSRGYTKTVRAAATGDARWQLPWSGDAGRVRYWAETAGDGYQRAPKIDKLWQAQVPLRWAAVPPLDVDLPGATAAAELLMYPTGMAAIITVTAAGQLQTDGVGHLAFVFDQERHLRFATQPAGETSGTKKVLRDLLDLGQGEVLAATDSPWTSHTLFPTVVTVTGVTDWPTDPFQQGDAVHRMLADLARMQQLPAANVGQLVAQLVPPRESSPETTRLWINHGAAIWSPDQAATPQGPARLRSYHHNLRLTLAHTSVLLDTAAWAGSTSSWANDDALKPLIKRCLILLGLLNGKRRDLFNSALARRLIQTSDLLDTINAARVEAGLKANMDSDTPPNPPTTAPAAPPGAAP